LRQNRKSFGKIRARGGKPDVISVFVMRNDSPLERLRQRIIVQIRNVIPFEVCFNQELPVGAFDRAILAIPDKALQGKVIQVVPNGAENMVKVY